jgi:oxalate decarboxylase/phosphoglucose isomerase-like protein (cupin superfamily)
LMNWQPSMTIYSFWLFDRHGELRFSIAKAVPVVGCVVLLHKSSGHWWPDAERTPDLGKLS